MKKIQVDVSQIKKVLKDWIDETSSDNVQEIYNQNFDEEIKYDYETGMFEISEEEAMRVGLEVDI